MTNPFHATNPLVRSLAWVLSITLAVTLLYLSLPMGSSAKSAAELQSEIARKRAKESALSSDINNMSSKIQRLRGRIGKLQQTQDNIEVDLDRKVSRQQMIAGELSKSRKRLAWLKRRLAHSRSVLAKRIVAVYKAGDPDIVTVVLQSEGFAELVERTTYLGEIAKQDNRIIIEVTELKGATKKETVRLASLEAEAAKLVAVVKQRRDQVASAKNQLDSRRDDLASSVSSRKTRLAVVSKSRRGDEEDLAAMSQSSGTVMGFLNNSPGPVKRGSGRFIYPTTGQFTSPFGQRWGRLHAGVDIAAPSGTAIRAVDTGTVRFAGSMSGYGNYTCIQHSGSLSTCYAHQSAIGVSVGQSVKQGQVIGAVGNTGHSFGAHLHFEVRVNGSPVDPMGYL